jgi:hypothetical protein
MPEREGLEWGGRLMFVQDVRGRMRERVEAERKKKGKAEAAKRENENGKSSKRGRTCWVTWC